MPDNIAPSAHPLHSHACHDPAATIDRLFLSQVAHRPDKTAIIEGARALSYHQLAERVAAVALELERAKVRRGDIVAILSRRSIELVAAELAVLSLGAAFVALDPGHPADHLRRILGEAAPVVVLTHSEQVVLAGEVVATDYPVIGHRSDGIRRR